MVKTLVLSFGTLSLAALGAVGLRAGDEKAAARDGACGPCCETTTCDRNRPATLECHDGGCTVKFKTDDGRDGVIELACDESGCKVVKCEPCCDDACKTAESKAAVSKPAECAGDAIPCPPAGCCGTAKGAGAGD